ARTLERLDAAGLLPDGLELATSSPAARFYVPKASRLNQERYRLPVVGASDAHFREAIGTGYTRFEGRSGADLRHAFQAGTVSGGQEKFPSLRDVGVLRALCVPVAGLRATPKQLGWKRTAWSFVSRYRVWN